MKKPIALLVAASILNSSLLSCAPGFFVKPKFVRTEFLNKGVSEEDLVDPDLSGNEGEDYLTPRPDTGRADSSGSEGTQVESRDESVSVSAPEDSDLTVEQPEAPSSGITAIEQGLPPTAEGAIVVAMQSYAFEGAVSIEAFLPKKRPSGNPSRVGVSISRDGIGVQGFDPNSAERGKVDVIKSLKEIYNSIADACTPTGRQGGTGTGASIPWTNQKNSADFSDDGRQNGSAPSIPIVFKNQVYRDKADFHNALQGEKAAFETGISGMQGRSAAGRAGISSGIDVETDAHNAEIDALRGTIPIVKGMPGLTGDNYPFQTPRNSEQGEVLRQAVQYKNYVKQRVAEAPPERQDECQKFLEQAEQYFKEADAAYSRGNTAEGDAHLINAIIALDAATGMKPPDPRNMARALAGTVEPRIHPSCTGSCATRAAQSVQEVKKTLAQVASLTPQEMANSPALIDEAMSSLQDFQNLGVDGINSVIEQLRASVAHNTANDYWFKNSPVPESARNALKTDIAIFDSGRAEQLTGALKTWNGPASSEQQKILDSVVAFGEVSRAYQTLRPEEKVFSQSSLASVLDGLITSAQFLGKVAVGFTPVGDVVDFYETFLGKDFYTGEELSTWGRALTGVGLIWGSGKFWRAAGEEIAGIAPLTKSIEDFTKQAQEIGIVDEKSLKRVVNDVYHIFGKKIEQHKLSQFLEKSNNNPFQAFTKLEKSAQQLADSGVISGIFETSIQVDEFIIFIRGNVINGKVRLGTAYIK